MLDLDLGRRGDDLLGDRSLGLLDHQGLAGLVDGPEDELLGQRVVEHLGHGARRGLGVGDRALRGLEPDQVDAGGSALGVGHRDATLDGVPVHLELALLLLDVEAELLGDGTDLRGRDDGGVLAHLVAPFRA